MTNYSTETEAESYEAADLARIALQAAIDAVDAYQARNGVCDAPFRVTLHVDNGNEADREGSFPPITTTAARETGAMTPHDGSHLSPVDSNAYVDIKMLDGSCDYDRLAGLVKWRYVGYYRVIGSADKNRREDA